MSHMHEMDVLAQRIGFEISFCSSFLDFRFDLFPSHTWPINNIFIGFNGPFACSFLFLGQFTNWWSQNTNVSFWLRQIFKLML